MFGEPLIVTSTFYRSGKTNFSESRLPAVCGSVNKRRLSATFFERSPLCLSECRSLCYGDYFLSVHVVIGERLAAEVLSVCFMGQIRAVYHLILELDVCQLRRVHAFDHLISPSQREFKHQVAVQSLGVEDAVVGQDLVVQPDAILRPVDFGQLVFGGDVRLVACIAPGLAQVYALDPFAAHFVSLLLRKAPDSSFCMVICQVIYIQLKFEKNKYI